MPLICVVVVVVVVDIILFPDSFVDSPLCGALIPDVVCAVAPWVSVVRFSVRRCDQCKLAQLDVDGRACRTRNK